MNLVTSVATMVLILFDAIESLVDERLGDGLLNTSALDGCQ
jgi:hypothetical protein